MPAEGKTAKPVKDVIAERRLTYKEIGDMIGITPQAVNEIVNGRTRSATARYSVAKALGLEVDDLIWPEPPAT